MLIFDNDTTAMPDADDTNSDNHDSQDQLWNEDLLKNYILKVLNMLEFSYSTSLKTSSALLTNITFQILNKHDKDSHDKSFES